MADLEGEQTGAVQNELVNRIPSAATLSTFGVLTPGSP
jgi:hypothetical protein